ncbi:ATP-binding protein [Novosphingobium sp.]|uniref:ATP-binding protein n=1 Tax=Novosphingobium sp. TaxID=1874826 RepID=UPI003B51E6B6
MTTQLGRTIIRPIEALSRATRALAEGRKADPPQRTLRVTEIDRLIRDFATMAADAERLNRLISRLLELGKADMQRPVGNAGCNVTSLLVRLADGLSGEGFSVTYKVPESMDSPAIDAHALETVLTTLIDNARAAGARRVAMEVSRHDDDLLITIADDGRGIPEADHQWDLRTVLHQQARGSRDRPRPPHRAGVDRGQPGQFEP